MLSIPQDYWDEPTNPLVDAAIEQAEKYERMLRRYPTLTAHQAMVLTLLRRVRELEEENAMLRRLG